MPRRLKGGGSRETISPLIDVVMNAFGMMFIVLMVYVSVFHRPGSQTRALAFLKATPPAVIPGQPYLYVLPIVGSSGDVTVKVTKGDPARLGLVLDQRSGAVYGQKNSIGTPVGSTVGEECTFEAADSS